MRAAWSQARADLARHERCRKLVSFDIGTLTLRQAFAAALRRQWNIAKGVRATRLWQIERDAEAKRRQTLPPREATILNLQDARFVANMIDSTSRMLAEVAAIDAQIASLRVTQ